MSRIGKLPVKIPEKVKVSVDGNLVKVEGPKGKMSFPTNPRVKVAVDKGEVQVTRPDDSPESKGLHGLTRTLVKNALDGVVKGYERGLEINGVGFKAAVNGKVLNLALGYSHDINMPIPEGINVKVDNNTFVTISGFDKHMVGQVAATIYQYYPVEPYKGKGVRIAGQHVRRKEGKKAG